MEYEILFPTTRLCHVGVLGSPTGHWEQASIDFCLCEVELGRHPIPNLTGNPTPFFKVIGGLQLVGNPSLLLKHKSFEVLQSWREMLLCLFWRLLSTAFAVLL